MVTTTCPYWTPREHATLIKLINEGAALSDIAVRLKRSPDAVKMKLKRLGVTIPQKGVAKKVEVKVTKNATTTTLPPITPAEELISMKEMMQTLLGALNQLQNPKRLSALEIRRCRTIISAARTYMRMLEKFQRWSRVEQEMVDMQARFLETYKRNLQTTKDPAEKARLEKEIKQLEESLKKEGELYNIYPNKKKQSLMGPMY